MVNRHEFDNNQINQGLNNTCVIANYAVAISVFTDTTYQEILQAYCQEHGIDISDSNDLGQVFDSHFHNNCSLLRKSGYEVILELHNSGEHSIFVNARKFARVELISNSQVQRNRIEPFLTSQTLTVANIFFKTYSYNLSRGSMHSLTFGCDEEGYFLYDTNIGKIQDLGSLTPVDIGEAYDAFLFSSPNHK